MAAYVLEEATVSTGGGACGAGTGGGATAVVMARSWCRGVEEVQDERSVAECVICRNTSCRRMGGH